MTDLRAVEGADVYKGDVLAGTLTRRHGEVEFRYSADYLAGPGGAVAWTLPKSDAAVVASAGSVPPYFAGLLPEGARLAAVVSATKTSLDDQLTLLLAVGSDAVGDVRVVPHGVAPAEPPVVLDDSSVGGADLGEVFADVTGRDPLARDWSAVPGVQPKVSAAMVSAPVATSRGPAILKLNPPAGFPRLVENEDFFLRVAQACGLVTPKHELVHDALGRAGLLVRRFDRVLERGRFVRLAQEDACQVAGLYPAAKYRVKTEQVVAALAGVVEAGGGSAAVARLTLLRWVVFAYAIGNGDLHAKNFSVRESSETWEVTPAYDLVSTQPYTRWRDPMALDLYGRANRLTGSFLVEAAGRWGLPPRAALRVLDEVVGGVEQWVGRVDEIGFDERVTELLAGMLRDRLAVLRRR